MTGIDENNNIKINGILRTYPERYGDVTEAPHREQGSQKKETKDDSPRDEAKDHLSELKALVGWANRECEAEGCGYRFRLRISGEDVFIDIVVADGDGRIRAIMAREITHEEVLRTVEHIRKGEGILFDAKG